MKPANGRATRWAMAAILLVALGGYLAYRLWCGTKNEGAGPTTTNDGGRNSVGRPQGQGDGAEEHPLLPAIRWAREIRDHLDQDVQDYTCTFVKRERLQGVVGEPEYVTAKFRNQPFSVSMRFTKPKSLEGQEAIFVEGQNNDNMLARGVGLARLAGWVSLNPTGPIPMLNNHYPITESGIRNLTKRLLEVAESDLQHGECTVQFFKDVKINGAPTTCIEVIHPTPRRNFLFHKARIYIDDQLNLPIRYEAYDWPAKPGDEPQLIEEYTYLNLKINVGLTDADFDPKTYD